MINAVLEVPRDHQALFVEYTSPFWSKKKKKKNKQIKNTRLNKRAQPMRNLGMQVEKKDTKII